MRKILILILIYISITLYVSATEVVYVFQESYANMIYSHAQKFFEGSNIVIKQNAMGVILSFLFSVQSDDCKNLNSEILKNLKKIEQFLAKNKNPVIIEVHTKKIAENNFCELKDWEMATLIANMIERELLLDNKFKDKKRFKSVGYGEFISQKNTPYNGFNYDSRVDIMILCNMSGD